MRTRLRKLEEKPRLKMTYDVFAVLVTFHFVVIGWVWFALPEFAQAWDIFSRLFGF